MKVIKPVVITPAMVVSNNAPSDLAPTWVAGTIYEPNTSVATDQASHVQLIQKTNFADGSIGGWYSPGAIGHTSSSGRMRVKDRDNLEESNSFPVTPGEVLHVAFNVDASGSDYGGAFGVFFHSGLQTLWWSGVRGWAGVAFAPRTAWTRLRGSVVVPEGVTHAVPWALIDAFPLLDASRPFVEFEGLYISRGQEGSSSPNLVNKPTFSDATLGAWIGGASGLANIAAVSYSQGGDGMISILRRDAFEYSNYFKVYPGEVLHVSCSVSSLSNSYGGNFGVMLLDADGAAITWAGAGYAPNVSWTDISAKVTIPNGAVFAVPWLQIACDHGVTDAVSYFKNPYIGRHAKWTLGPYVRRNRRVYERVTTGPNTAAPENDPVNWLDIGPTNEWAMFDREISTYTSKPGSLSVTLRPGYVNSLSLYGLNGSTLQVLVRNGLDGAIVYGNADLTGPREISLDGTLITDWYQYYYEPTRMLVGITLTDLPPYLNAHITVTVTGSAEVTVGVLDVGSYYDLGGTGYGATMSLVDYSKKTTDEYGQTLFVKRGFAKRLSAKMMFDNVQLSKVLGVLADLRATPCSWSATDVDGLESLNIFGWFEDVDIDVAYATQSYCTVTVQGLSE